jgi:hypothetical protein
MTQVLNKKLMSDEQFWQSSRIQSTIQKSEVFLNTSNEHAKKEVGKRIPFVLASKNYLRINLTKEMKDLYNENYKIMKKKIEEDTRR